MRRVNHVPKITVRHKVTGAVIEIPASSLRLHRHAGWEPADGDPARTAPSAKPAGTARPEPAKPSSGGAGALESTAAAAPAGRGGDQKKESK